MDDGNRTHDNRNHNPALYQLSYAHHNALLLTCPSLMAHPAGLEPATIRLEGGCSIQLSYGRLSFQPNRTSESLILPGFANPCQAVPDKCGESYRRP
ncbi:hypothetical protein EMIT047CA2_240042 [Pseudomonas soli]